MLEEVTACGCDCSRTVCNCYSSTRDCTTSAMMGGDCVAIGLLKLGLCASRVPVASWAGCSRTVAPAPGAMAMGCRVTSATGVRRMAILACIAAVGTAARRRSTVPATRPIAFTVSSNVAGATRQRQ